MSKPLKAPRETASRETAAKPVAAPEPGGHDELPEVLARVSAIIAKMLARLRAGQEVLKTTAVAKLHDTSEKLHEVSSATETAATDILDGIDRAMLLIDQLEGDDVGPRGAEIAGQLREELFGVMNHLQFQDITSQQLSHASSIIQDMEQYLDEFVAVVDAEAGGTPPARGEPAAPAYPRAFDPAATVHRAEQRQALVDELLTADPR